VAQGRGAPGSASSAGVGLDVAINGDSLSRRGGTMLRYQEPAPGETRGRLVLRPTSQNGTSWTSPPTGTKGTPTFAKGGSAGLPSPASGTDWSEYPWSNNRAAAPAPEMFNFPSEAKPPPAKRLRSALPLPAQLAGSLLVVKGGGVPPPSGRPPPPPPRRQAAPASHGPPLRPDDIEFGMPVVFDGGCFGSVDNLFISLDEFWVREDASGDLVEDASGIRAFRAAELRLILDSGASEAAHPAVPTTGEHHNPQPAMAKVAAQLPPEARLGSAEVVELVGDDLPGSSTVSAGPVELVVDDAPAPSWLLNDPEHGGPSSFWGDQDVLAQPVEPSNDDEVPDENVAAEHAAYQLGYEAATRAAKDTEERAAEAAASAPTAQARLASPGKVSAGVVGSVGDDVPGAAPAEGDGELLGEAAALRDAAEDAEEKKEKRVMDWAQDQAQFKDLPPLPEFWIRIRSSSGKLYYMNTDTGQSTYTQPVTHIGRQPRAAIAAPKPAPPPQQREAEAAPGTPRAAWLQAGFDPLPSGWREMTSRSSGRTYYWHDARQESTFDRPTDAM